MEQRAAFNASKRLLLSSKVLTHFDEQLDVRLACDALAYGVGTVVSHVLPNGTERPIGFASQTLSNAEHKYSQIEKEALACVPYRAKKKLSRVANFERSIAVVCRYFATNCERSVKVVCR